MSKRHIKVKINNGIITPLEPIENFSSENAVIVFLDDYINEDQAILSLIANDPANADIFSNEEDIYTLNDGKPFND